MYCKTIYYKVQNVFVKSVCHTEYIICDFVWFSVSVCTSNLVFYMQKCVDGTFCC
jgi:hypothetical protein